MDARLTQAQGQALLDYLVKCPFIEVHELIRMLQSLPPADSNQEGKGSHV